MATGTTGKNGTPARQYTQPVGTSTDAGLKGTLKRTGHEFLEDNLSDGAAALTYYGLLSMFPALIVLVSVVGLFGNPVRTTKRITDIVSNLGPTSAVNALEGPVREITANRPGAGLALVLGLAGALWAASGYIGALTRSTQTIFETPEGRPIWKLKPIQLVLTIVMVLLSAVVAVSLVLTGPIVKAVADPLGVGSVAITAWSIFKWPVLGAIVVLMLSVLYYVTPNVRQRGFLWVVPGAVVAMVVWLAASIAFAIYVSNFGSYNKTYGTLAGIVAFLVWLWITNLAVLFGLEFNAERERTIEMREGTPGAEREIQLEPRSQPKPPRTG